MSKKILRNKLLNDNKSKAVEHLITQSRPDLDFFLMTILSVVMATFGLLINNASVIIGSMLIAPLLWPILSFSLGLVVKDHKLILRSLGTIIKAVGFAIIASAIVTMLFSDVNNNITPEIIARTKPSIVYLGIAIVAGLAASYALITPSLNESFTGIAISVALIPPVAVVGIGIANLNQFLIVNAATLFFINTIGIIAISFIIFYILNLSEKKEVAKVVVAKDEIEMAEEKILEE